MAEPNTRDLKLIQYLGEAYGKEKELETALQAHIGMATRQSYKKRLQQHLRETKGHARAVERRIKQLGGKAEIVDAPGPQPVSDAAGVVVSAASKAVSAAKGPIHALRGTGEQETQLKNAKTEFSEEAEEIANYTAIEALAEAVGDRETAKVARGIRREEERMQRFLERLIPQLTKAVAKDEIPTAERNGGGGRSSRGGSRSGTSARSRSRSSTSARSRSRSASGGSRSRSVTGGGRSSGSSGRRTR